MSSPVAVDEHLSSRARAGSRRWPLVALAMLACLAQLVLGCGAALAHVEIVGRPVEAGQSDAVVRFHASAESVTAGIGALEVDLPDEIAPQDVEWESGPQGWAFQRTESGFLAAGPAPVPGMPVDLAVRLRSVPEREVLLFPTTVIYADGERADWKDTPVAKPSSPTASLPPCAPRA